MNLAIQVKVKSELLMRESSRRTKCERRILSLDTKNLIIFMAERVKKMIRIRQIEANNMRIVTK